MKELEGKRIGEYELVVLESVDSTNTYAINMALEEKFKDNVSYVIVAEEQTAGRGRLGRNFESDRSKGILATFLVRPEKKACEVANITLVMALAVVRTLDEIIDEKVQIKWPNDIILNGRKLCGILTEMRNSSEKVKFVALGVGINVNNEGFSKEIENKATSLCVECGKTFDRVNILEKLIEKFNELYELFIENTDLTFMIKEYNDRLININKEVIVEYKNEKVKATQCGVDERGVLKVIIDNKETSITSGEILVRGVHGYV